MLIFYILLTKKQVLPEIEMTHAYFGLVNDVKEISFQKTITKFGACVTFNMYDEKELLRDGYVLSINEMYTFCEWSKNPKQETKNYFSLNVA